ncbi:MAG TPA: hypothetical protein VFW60_03340 [Rhodanobacteraceae bacterium]|nr:hypothetical protein [Rhodanobacteraceae bacterium]
MNIPRPARIVMLLCGFALLAGCTAFRTADNELDATSRQLTTENLTLNADADNVPQAEITPRGDFLIAGKPVPLTPQQHDEVLAYRAQSVSIAQEGIAIGHQGLEAGRRAVVPIVFAALFGASGDHIDGIMNGKLAGVRKAIEKLCDRLPRMQATQQQLATELPAFKPYATLTRKDVDDCREDALNDINVADD